MSSSCLIFLRKKLLLRLTVFASLSAMTAASDIRHSVGARRVCRGVFIRFYLLTKNSVVYFYLGLFGIVAYVIILFILFLAAFVVLLDLITAYEFNLLVYCWKFCFKLKSIECQLGRSAPIAGCGVALLCVDIGFSWVKP